MRFSTCYGLSLEPRSINFTFLILNMISATRNARPECPQNLIARLIENRRGERSTRRATSSLSSFTRSLATSPARVQRTRASRNSPAILPITWHVGAANFKTSARRSVGRLAPRCARLSHAPAAATFVSLTACLVIRRALVTRSRHLSRSFSRG